MSETPLSAAQRRALAELLRVFPVADEIGARFAAAGHELHLVGGSVRDALLGRLGDDLEFATIGGARQGLRLEITTYRADAYDKVSRKPAVEYGTSLLENLRRRDFTVNAMAVSVPGHRFTDPYRGLDDLAARRLRTPSSPEDSFGDDPLRMLRAARFAAQLRFLVAPEA